MRIYVSHPIRGKNGDAATEEEKQANCEAAIKWADLLRMNLGLRATQGGGLYLGGHWLTHRDWIYVPAEHEEFIGRAYGKGYLTEEQILDIDCEILKECDLLVVLGEPSTGMRVEIGHAKSLNIPIHYDDI